MSDFKIGDYVWIISFELDNEFYLLSQQEITALLDDNIECEDDFNTFHVDYKDAYKTKAEALDAMIAKLEDMRRELN